MLDSLLIASVVFVVLWILILICTFTKISTSYKVSISLIMLAFLTVFTNRLCAVILDIPNNNDISNIVVAVIMIMIAIILGLKELLSKKD